MSTELYLLPRKYAPYVLISGRPTCPTRLLWAHMGSSTQVSRAAHTQILTILWYGVGPEWASPHAGIIPTGCPQCRSGVTYWYPCDPHFMPVQYRAAHPGSNVQYHSLVHESIISKKQWTAQYRLHTGNQHGGLREVTLLWYISKIMLLSLSLEYLPCKYIVYC